MKHGRAIEESVSVVSSEITQTKISVTENAFDTLNRLGFDLDKRIVFVDGDIDDDFGDWFRKLIWVMEQKSNEDITVWLNTPGGSVYSMYQFYDTILASPCKFTVIGHGQICSAGVLMLACAHKRLVTENCVLMSHEGADFNNADLRYSEAKERRKLEDWIMSQWNVLMARHTPYDAQHWKSITARKAEFWLLGGRAIVNYGLADALYEPAGVIAERFPDRVSAEDISEA